MTDRLPHSRPAAHTLGVVFALLFAVAGPASAQAGLLAGASKTDTPVEAVPKSTAPEPIAAGDIPIRKLPCRVHKLQRLADDVMLLDLKNPLRTLRQMKPRKHMMEEMGAAYMAQGIVTLAGSRAYTSMADSDEVIDDALDRFEYVLSGVEGAS